VKDYRIALRYGRALLALAEEHGQLESVENELAQAASLVVRHPEISHLLMHATISREEKEDFLDKILPRNFSSLTVNFLKVLVKKGRFLGLSLIQERFHRLYEEKMGLQRVRVEAPFVLDKTLEEKLRRALEKKLNRKIYLETTVNPEILGGLVLDFDGTQIDASFRSKLLELKQRLLNPRA